MRIFFFQMLSKAVIPLQTLTDAVKEGDQKPEKLNCIQQRSQSTPCEASSPLSCGLHSYLPCSKGQQTPNSTLDWQRFMYIPPSHFELAQMTTPEGAQQKIRRSLPVPKAESPQEGSPPGRPAHEVGTFHVVRKSSDPFNTTWCWPSERRAGWCAMCLTLPNHVCHIACVCVLYPPDASGFQQPDLQPQQTSAALLYPMGLRRYSSSPRTRPLE